MLSDQASDLLTGTATARTAELRGWVGGLGGVAGAVVDFAAGLGASGTSSFGFGTQPQPSHSLWMLLL